MVNNKPSGKAGSIEGGMFKNIDFTSLKTIMIVAGFFRILAALFSQGYGMHDDHFLIIEASASWVDGYDYNNWLPWNKPEGSVPEGHSFTYVGLNFIFFYILKGIGLTDPKMLMVLNRLLHGLFSLLTVYFGYKITTKISTKENATIVGWFLAVLWIFPFMAVRNLVEITCMPFIMWSLWLYVKSNTNKDLILSGILMGLAVSFRYQIGVFAIGLALHLLIRKDWKPFLLFCSGVLLLFVFTQGLVDYLIWGYPFAEMLSYVLYNMDEGTRYMPNANSFMYIEVLMGIMLVPLGLAMGLGYFRSAKKYAFMFLPSLLFLLFHSFYPSKQERFILPILPVFIMLGVLGYHTLRNKKGWNKFWKISMKAFWVLNIPLLLMASVTYSKKSRVEAMYFFYENNLRPKYILTEGSGRGKTSMFPKFYSGKWDVVFANTTVLDSNVDVSHDYIIFSDLDLLESRVQFYKETFPNMERIEICDPSFADKVVKWINPVNRNEYFEIWATNTKASQTKKTSK